MPNKTTSAKSTKSVRTDAKPRRRGERVVTPSGRLDRRQIVACAYDLAKSVSLQDLSIVRVARELGVTPALIYYYLRGRDQLTSSVMNAFYRDIMEGWPALSGDWRHDVELAAFRVYRAHVAHPGIAAYVVSHNRFRLEQLVEEGETDYGILLFDRFVGPVREAGFDPHRTGMWAHLLMEFIVSSAYATVRHRWPGEHGEFLDNIFRRLDPAAFPNACFVRESYVRLKPGEAFAESLRLMLSAIEIERQAIRP